ncbi:MAG: potassium channel family protein [Nanoarchaeota archaeon]|nr:potassium channel family protein [Nanoarchaeota archaeon]
MEHKQKTKVIAAVATIIILIGIGTVVYHEMERWNYIESFYFSVISLTTIGYGDLYPTTDASRLFTAFYVLAGVATVFAALGIIGSEYITNREKQVIAVMKKMKLAEERQKNKKLSQYK